MYGMKFLWPFEVSLKTINGNENYKYNFSITSETSYLDEVSIDSIEKTVTINSLKAKNEEDYRFRILTEINNLKLNPLKIRQQGFIERLHGLTEDIDITITKRGVIKSINNKNEIIDKWVSLKEKLTHKFKGSKVERYLSKLEEKIHNEEEFLNDMNQNRLLGFLWNNQYSIYTKEANTIVKTKEHLQTIEYYPLYVDESLVWVGDKEASPIKIEIRGEINERTPISIIKKYFKRKKGLVEADLELKEYSGYYILNKDTGWIENSNFTMSLSYGQGYTKTQHIQLQRL